MRKIKTEIVVSDEKLGEFHQVLKALHPSITGFIRFGKDHTVEIYVKDDSPLSDKEISNHAIEALKYEKITLRKKVIPVNIKECFIVHQTQNEISVLAKNKKDVLSQLKERFSDFEEVK